MTAINDALNAGFEFSAALFVLNHCRVLYRDKATRGVSIISTAFFALWGAWNLYYYPSLGQIASFIAGVAVMLANTLWVTMMVHYNKTPASDDTDALGDAGDLRSVTLSSRGIDPPKIN